MISYFKFPASEVQVKYQSSKLTEQISLVTMPTQKELEGSINDRLMALLMLCDMKERYNEPYDLFIPYLPYSREDRPVTDRAFSLKVLGDILNTRKYRNCYTLDVHSDVAFGCIRNLINIPVESILEQLKLNLKEYALIIPDQGAYKKLAKLEYLFSNTVVALKQRNVSDGRVVVKELVGDVKGKNCLILDDICDGGSTFTQLASELWKKEPSNIDLFVTHGIFSKGLSPLFTIGINNIYTTNSYYYGDGYRSENGFKNLVISNCQSIFNNFCWGDAHEHTL